MENKCVNMAYIRRYWPGREPDLVCSEHASKSKNIAKLMGIYIHLESIAYSIKSKEPPGSCAGTNLDELPIATMEPYQARRLAKGRL